MDRAQLDGDRALVQAAVSVVAPWYERAIRTAVTEPAIGVAQLVYWDAGDASQCAAETVVIPARKLEWCASERRMDLLWRLDEPSELAPVDVEFLDVYEQPTMLAQCEALVAASETDDEARLVNMYYMSLAETLHRALDLIVVINSYDGVIQRSVRDQVTAQLDADAAREWAAQGWLP